MLKKNNNGLKGAKDKKISDSQNCQYRLLNFLFQITTITTHSK